ncbi:MAG TPA: hypothetical protein VMH80_08025 [Bryobacteraceae bacterium]|nr:hypothetical protein [Bryobacteraceae bacterium]
MAWISRIVFLCLAPLFGWNRVELGKNQHVKATRRVPKGQVEIIDHSQKPSGERVDIWSYGTIYGALGVTGEQFSQWESRYGMDSLGVGTGGSLFIPGFPVLSKVAWMYIDPVDLSGSETGELVSECERAMAETRDPAACEVLRQIRDLAQRAIQKSATVRFGHP